MGGNSTWHSLQIYIESGENDPVPMPSHDRFSLFFAFFNEKSNFLPPKLFFSRKWCSIKLFLIKFRVEMTRRWKFLTAKKKSYCHFILIFHDFSTPIPSLNQGQGSIFKVRECAQSITSEYKKLGDLVHFLKSRKKFRRGVF